MRVFNLNTIYDSFLKLCLKNKMADEQKTKRFRIYENLSESFSVNHSALVFITLWRPL